MENEVSTEMPSVWSPQPALHDWPCTAQRAVPCACAGALCPRRRRVPQEGQGTGGDGCGQMGDMTVAFMSCQGWGQPYRGRDDPRHKVQARKRLETVQDEDGDKRASLSDK